MARRFRRRRRRRRVARGRSRRRPNRRGRRSRLPKGVFVIKDVTQLTGFLHVDNATTEAVGGITFRLSRFPRLADLLQYFQEYALLKARVEFFPVLKYNDGQQNGILQTAIDHNDSNIIVGDSLDSYTSMRQTGGFSHHVRWLRPSAAQEIFAIPGTTAFSRKRGLCWLDVAAANVRHYGLKMRLFPVDPGAQPAQYFAQDYNLRITTWVAYRGRSNQ